MNDNRCVCCGRIIPEGRQVCPACENKKLHENKMEYLFVEWVLPLTVIIIIILSILKITGHI